MLLFLLPCFVLICAPGKRAKREGMLLYDMFREARILKRADEHICLVVTGPNLAAFLNHPDLQVSQEAMPEPWIARVCEIHQQ